MKVYMKCFSTLVNPDTCNFSDSTPYDLIDGQTVGQLAECAGIAKEDIKIVFVNNKKVNLDAVLNDGDRVGLAPAVGGM